MKKYDVEETVKRLKILEKSTTAYGIGFAGEALSHALSLIEDYQRQTEAIKLFMSAFPELTEEVAGSK